MRSRAGDPPITLSEHGGIRSLHFGSPWVQGAMRIRAPEALVFEYTRRMFAWLLLRDEPADLAQFGLGAGSLTRWALAKLPGARVTAVESAASVIACAHAQFALPMHEPRLAVVHDDAHRFARRASNRTAFDVLQVDVYDRDARGPALDSPAFYASCRAVLRPPGVAVFNLFNEPESFAPNRARIRGAFDGRVLEMPPVPAGNVIVLALAGPPLEVAADAVVQRGRSVRERYGLPADQWARLLLDRHASGGRLSV